jgi:uncharacterized protein YcaQ
VARAKTIPNRVFRRWLLSIQGLAPPIPGDGLDDPKGLRGSDAVAAIARRLGFVQIDPIAVVARAHDQILFVRNPSYRPGHLKKALEQRRTLFENWSHDAAILPVELFPHWRHYMARFKRGEVHPGYSRYFAAVTAKSVATARRHVEQHGPTRPRDIASEKVNWGIVNWPAPTVARITLEYLWRTGEMAIAARAGQEKIYDLASRVIPEPSFKARVSKRDYIDWACRAGLSRLGAASPAQIARLFDAISTDQAQAWCEKNLGQELVQVQVELADRSRTRQVFATRDSIERLDHVPNAPGKLRLLSPFDPLIHDRKRTAQVFGFDYTVEIFVPAAKRRYGYYVLPILEGERFVGRIDLKLDRKAGRLDVLGLWWEQGFRPTAPRRQRLRRQLERQARFAGVEGVGGKNV